MTPCFSSRESRTIEGILHATSTAGDRHASNAPILYDVDVIKLENGAKDVGSTAIYDSCQKVEWDQFTKQRLFATLKGSVHSIDLRWLPILESTVAREEGLKLDSISNDLPLPEVKRVLSKRVHEGELARRYFFGRSIGSWFDSRDTFVQRCVSFDS